MVLETTEKNLKESFYEIFRDDIINLKLRPGMLFSIKEVCDIYEFGRSPVREALIRLEQEALIEFLPQKGTVISKIDLKRVSDERFLRKSLEESVMEEFMYNFSPSSIRRLETCVLELEACLREGDLRKFVEVDDKFHFVLYEETGREFCKDILRTQSGHYHRMRLLAGREPGVNEKILEDHQRLVSALARLDIKKARKVFTEHIDIIDGQARHLLKTYPELFVSEIEECEKRIVLDFAQDFLQDVVK